MDYAREIVYFRWEQREQWESGHICWVFRAFPRQTGDGNGGNKSRSLFPRFREWDQKHVGWERPN